MKIVYSSPPNSHPPPVPKNLNSYLVIKNFITSGFTHSTALLPNTHKKNPSGPKSLLLHHSCFFQLPNKILFSSSFSSSSSSPLQIFHSAPAPRFLTQ